MRMVLLLLVVCGFIPSLASAQEPTRKPNVLLILSDDQGWGDFSLHGNTDLKTPNLDAIAKSGAQFERFFVQPVCSPTRAEMLTGRYHPRCGVRDVSLGGERLNLDENTIADELSKSGYVTGIFGKWHNGTQYPYHPIGRGFQEYYGFTSGHWGDYFDPPLDHNGKAVRGKGYLADDLTDHAITFVNEKRDKPFFCYVAYNTPHSPMQVPSAYWDRFRDKALTLGPTGPQKMDVGHTRAALAMCENLDDNIGRLQQALRQRQHERDTIVVFFCDNGPNGWRWNGGMKGRKGTTDEGGVRSPLFISWPGTIAANTRITPIAGAIDLLPTLLGLTGAPRAGVKPLDGRNFAHLLRGEKFDAKTLQDRVLFQHWAGRVSARSQTHRLDAEGKLFDMTADPGQKKDVSATQPAIAKQLKDAVTQWRSEVLAELPKKDERAFPVGFRSFPAATLPARDGIPHGTIRRSANAPNCSYFTHWTKPDDSITWEVEVATGGVYRVDMLYTCAKENVGVTMQLSLGDAKLTQKVTEAHDPSARGNENDRVPRVGESLVKDFKPLTLGDIKLPQGRGQLTLRATDIPGKEAIEVRSLILTLKEK